MKIQMNYLTINLQKNQILILAIIPTFFVLHKKEERIMTILTSIFAMMNMTLKIIQNQNLRRKTKGTYFKTRLL